MNTNARSKSRALMTLAVAAAALTVGVPGCASGGLSYPEAARGVHVDTYHGVEIPDPYRWLEETDSPQTQAWIKANNAVTFGYLQTIATREPIRARLTELWNNPRTGVPFQRGGRYFYTRNTGLQAQSVLYVTDDVAEAGTGGGRVLLDPNTLSKDGTVALSRYAVSRDGRYLAYGLSGGGSDWVELKVRDVDSGKDLSDHLRWVKFSSASWDAAGSGFYYARFPEPKESEKLTGKNFFHALYYHRLGTDQAADRLVYERKDHPRWGWGHTVTEDGRYLVINVWESTDPKNQIFYQDLQAGADAPVVELLTGFDASWSFLGNEGATFWFMTDKAAPRQRVVAIDLTAPSVVRELIPQSTSTLEAVSVVGERFVASYLTDAHADVKIFRLDGSLDKTLPMPTLGSVGGFSGQRTDRETFFTFTSFTFPATIYRYDFAAGAAKIHVPSTIRMPAADYETKQVFYASKDGARIPMFIVHKRGLKLDGKNPTYLYGYGGFNISMTPYYSTSLRVWMELGGVFAMPNLRGGGEYGEAWHQAGIKERKQNVFDDFIAAAEWLIAQGYTSRAKLAIGGGSNGGLLVGACMTQRPELFGAALPAVGVMDMLRFHTFTIGWAWVADYGSSEDPAMFPVLRAYSPYHNVRKGTAYPATMVTTADHDDRVVPGHSFKFAAALQAAHQGTRPVLIRVETKAGHGAGKPTDMRIAEVADKWAFLTATLGMTLPPGFGGAARAPKGP